MLSDGDFLAKLRIDTISSSALERKFATLAEIPSVKDGERRTYRFVSALDWSHLRILLVPANPGQRFDVVAILQLKPAPYRILERWPTVKQVSLAHASEEFQSCALMSSLYLTLAKAGHPVLSDDHQYAGGRNLWKRVARDAADFGMAVKPISAETGRFLQEDGKDVAYSPDMPDDRFWSAKPDTSLAHVLFMLSEV